MAEDFVIPEPEGAAKAPRNLVEFKHYRIEERELECGVDDGVRTYSHVWDVWFMYGDWPCPKWRLEGTFRQELQAVTYVATKIGGVHCQ